MRRRDFIGLMAGSAALPTAGHAQQQHRIAFIHSGLPVGEQTEASSTSWVATFFRELRRLGLVEGGNLAVARYSAGGSTDRYAALGAEIVAGKPEVIVANTAAPLMSTTKAIPLIAIMGDPLSTGLVASLAQPGGNVTGVTIDGGPGLIARRLQLLQEAAPTAARITVLAGTAQEARRAREVRATKLLLDVDETSLRRAFAELLAETAEGVVVSEQGSFLARRGLIVQLAAEQRLPAIYAYRDYVEAGGLMSYGPDLGEMGRRMAMQVQQILAGARPANIPVHQPTKFDLAVNLKTAASLGLSLPATLLASASDVIE